MEYGNGRGRGCCGRKKDDSDQKCKPNHHTFCGGSELGAGYDNERALGYLLYERGLHFPVHQLCISVALQLGLKSKI